MLEKGPCPAHDGSMLSIILAQGEGQRCSGHPVQNVESVWGGVCLGECLLPPRSSGMRAEVGCKDEGCRYTREGQRHDTVWSRMLAVVINFYAPWCPWCQRLEPTWEAVTQEVHTKYPDSDGRLRFAKVCCRHFCSDVAVLHWAPPAEKHSSKLGLTITQYELCTSREDNMQARACNNACNVIMSMR